MNIEKETQAIVWSMERALNSDHKPLEYQKKIAKTIKNFQITMKRITFDLDIKYMKGSIILLVNDICIQEFGNEKLENYDNTEDKIVHKV